MRDTAKIKPALSAEEWATWRDQQHAYFVGNRRGNSDDRFSAIAEHNAELPSDDPRKITREMLWAVGMVDAAFAGDPYEGMSEAERDVLIARQAKLRGQLCDIIAALLPPE